jgi:hypothetical protein
MRQVIAWEYFCEIVESSLVQHHDLVGFGKLGNSCELIQTVVGSWIR